MAPEYAMRGHFSIKSDVFSFGVLVLEIITGRKNSGTFDNEETEDLLSFVSTNTDLCINYFYNQQRNYILTKFQLPIHRYGSTGLMVPSQRQQICLWIRTIQIVNCSDAYTLHCCVFRTTQPTDQPCRTWLWCLVAKQSLSRLPLDRHFALRRVVCVLALSQVGITIWEASLTGPQASLSGCHRMRFQLLILNQGRLEIEVRNALVFMNSKSQQRLLNEQQRIITLIIIY